jgi:hypothetical protein
MVSVAALVILFVFSFSSITITMMHFGYPKIKLMYMTVEQKLVCTIVMLFNLAFMIFVSCFCYFKILQQRGKFGHNSVGVINDAVITPATPGDNLIKLYFFITDKLECLSVAKCWSQRLDPAPIVELTRLKSHTKDKHSSFLDRVSM